MDVDSLLVLRKTIRLLESLAAHEQAKGDRANLTKMADAMARAAQLSIALSEIETKLGISHRPPLSEIQVELVHTDAEHERLKAEAETLRQRVAELEQSATADAQKRDASRPVAESVAEPNPPAAPPAPSNNVVVPQETLIERKRRVEAEMGARPVPYSANYPVDPMTTDDPYRRGPGRFDNRII